MKRIVQAVFLLVCALALGFALYYLIQGRSGAAQASRPVATRQIVAESSNASGSAANGQAAEGGTPVNHIPAMPNEVILSVANLNVDQNEGDEQVLTVRKSDKPDGRLWIVVADYIEQKRSWVRAWDGETQSTKLTTFSIQARDLVGDHGMEILCTGMNDSGEQTMSVFRRSKGNLAFDEILVLAADSIAVGESERPEAYQQGQANGESWPVFAYTRDKDSANLFDQVKDRYAWDPRLGRYAKSGSERIPGAQVERETVSKVLTGSEKDFESFLQGVWYEAGKPPLDPGTRLILFDKATGGISFYKAGTQDVFRWTESHSTRYGLYVRCQNESVDDFVRLMDIELTGSDLVSIRVFEDVQLKADPEDRWDGAFRKLPRDIVKQVAASQSKPVPVDTAKIAAGESPTAPATDTQAPLGLGKTSLKLEGPYRAAGGVELSFARPRYSLKSAAAPTESGGFELYALGQDTVLDLIAIRRDGLPSARKTYKVSYIETRMGKDLLRRITLSPARAAIDGLELLQENDLVLEQRVKGS
jgi:hypothetical protein